ncbi:hypothetical protein T03_10886 [Trichinella britovi]|uniref:Uncharacterized protein n=1 Tax=Trichinella britovi TaxID=45882 RepID=A0A0V1AMP2_TRIBR|nr:hypothetical protein T03_10886 [Trichinella britovi]
MGRRLLTKSLLNFQIEHCISSVHIVLRHKLQFILSKKFQCAKTGFERCAMQITIAIKVSYRQLECTCSFDLRGKW